MEVKSPALAASTIFCLRTVARASSDGPDTLKVGVIWHSEAAANTSSVRDTAKKAGKLAGVGSHSHSQIADGM